MSFGHLLLRVSLCGLISCAASRAPLLVDTHIDTPYRLFASRDSEGVPTEDILHRTEHGDFDLPRARQGRLSVAFMAIYTPAEGLPETGARAHADAVIDMMERIVAGSVGALAIVGSVAQVEANHARGVMSLPLGMENGAPIEGRIENVEHFYRRGIRYITLAHSRDNDLADSSFDTRHTWRGLSPMGRDVIREMNRLGMMVDISHLSDEAASQAIELSTTPVIASHSACRHLTPGFERNISDELISAVAARGGVVQINFGSIFLLPETVAQFEKYVADFESFSKAAGGKPSDADVDAFVASYKREHPAIRASLGDVVAHIDHVVRLAGIDHVGLGSDFDGVGDAVPVGLEDVSKYPALLGALKKRGYSDADVAKIAGGNLLRVWRSVERARQPK